MKIFILVVVSRKEKDVYNTRKIFSTLQYRVQHKNFPKATLLDLANENQ